MFTIDEIKDRAVTIAKKYNDILDLMNKLQKIL